LPQGIFLDKKSLFIPQGIKKLFLNKNLIINYDLILLGITKSSLKNKSFLSAAAFQNTEYIITKSAINNTISKIKNIKDNTMLGRMIPSGTGLDIFNIKKLFQNDL